MSPLHFRIRGEPIVSYWIEKVSYQEIFQDICPAQGPTVCGSDGGGMKCLQNQGRKRGGMKTWKSGNLGIQIYHTFSNLP